LGDVAEKPSRASLAPARERGVVIDLPEKGVDEVALDA
jgi:hypothetical protein